MRLFRLASLRRFVGVTLFSTVFCTTLLNINLFAQKSAQSSAQAGVIAPLITQAIDESRLTTLTGNTYPKARAEFDLGAAPASLPMQRMLLVLKRSDAQQAKLTRLLDEQQDKSSANYHKWLAPEAFGRQFGPTDADMQTIKTWLESHGFQVGSTKGRTVLEFSGSASQVESAFHTPIHKYLVNGEQHWANARDPQIPAALEPAVAGIVSLHDFQRKAMNKFVGQYSQKTRRLTSPEPKFTYGCGGGECYAVSPYDFAAIYDVLPLWNAGTDGTGQTIAIVGRTNVNQDDATNFWSLFGLTVPQNKLNVILNGADPGINGDEAEADIDIQWSGAVAPQATVDFVTSASTDTSDGVDLSAIYIVENNLAPVMSESYGECELGLGTSGNQFFAALWSQAAAQGISVFVSSGDNSAAGCDYPGAPAQYGLNVNGIGSTPYNAAIGGTDFNEYNKWSTYWNTTNAATTQESAKGYIPETTWNDSCTNSLAITLGFGSTAEQACNNPEMLQDGGVITEGGSGGPSNCAVNTQGVVGSCSAGYAKPSWQTGTGVPPDNKRDLPDVSLFASNGFLGSFYVICERDATFGTCDLNDLAGYGGTSVASPAFAGIMALVNQKMGTPQGVPGFSLYQLVSKQANAFHDVPTGSTIAVPCFTGSPNCTTSTAGDQYGILSGYNTGAGYDLGTGLGTVDAANLVNNWGKATFTATATTLQLNNGTAVNATHGTAVPISIGVNPTAATGNAALLVSTGSGTTTGKDVDVFQLSGGTVSKTTSLLPGGTYSVIAHYGGDGTYGGSYSSPVSVTITKENSVVNLPGLQLSGSATTTVNYDSQYSLQAVVENSQGSACNPPPFGEIACPTGTINLLADGTAIGNGSYPLNNSGTMQTVPEAFALTGGTHTLTAQYSGDNNYNANSGTVSVTVNKAATNAAMPYVVDSDFKNVSITTLIQDPNSVPEGPITQPTGQVIFYSNGTPLAGTVTYSQGYGANYGLYAYLTTAFPHPGTYSITAGYSGDQNYLSSTSVPASATLQYPQPSMTLSPSTQTVAAGSSVTVTALVNSGNKTVYPTGSVTFVNQSVGGGVLAGPVGCTNATDSNGHFECQAAATFTVSSSLVVVAQYSGDTDYPAASSFGAAVNIPDFSVNAGPTVTTTQGQAPTTTISVVGSSGFSDPVSFSCSGLPAETTCGFSPAQVSGTGSTTLTITTMPLGQARRRAALEGHGIGWAANAMLLALGACLIGIPSWRRRGVLPMLLIVALFVGLPGCGGGGNTVTPPPNNPVPAITSLSPTQQAVGSQAQMLTINGSGFMVGSTATFNGATRAVNFNSASQIWISLGAGDLTATGSFPVVVTNPGPGGGPSGGVNFAVVTGTPTGSFNVTVTAVSGSLTHTSTFTLIVQ